MMWTNLNQGEDQLLLFHQAARGGRLEADCENVHVQVVVDLILLGPGVADPGHAVGFHRC